MSTDWVTIKCCNKKISEATLSFETGISGYKLVFKSENQYFKFWINHQTWEELKFGIDSIMSEVNFTIKPKGVVGGKYCKTYGDLKDLVYKTIEKVKKERRK